MSTRKKLHEKYHSRTKRQLKIIKDNNFTYRLLISVINRYLKVDDRKILDIGCGAGTLALYLAGKGNNVLGIDISSKAIRECLSSKKGLGLKNVNFRQLEFPKEAINEKFDVVLFTEVIEHLEDDKGALKNIKKLLKPKGVMILSTPSNTAPLHKLGLTKKFDREVGHLRRYSLTELKLLVKNSGFKIVEVQKTEGVLRNFLFINPIAEKFIRFFKFFVSDIVTYADNASISMFGYSNIIIVARKK